MSNDSPTLPRLLKVDEAAEFLHCSRATVYRLIHEGELPAFRLGHNGSLRLRVDAVEEWIGKERT